MKLAIALQEEMEAEVDKDENVVINIPNECKRDLWDAQLEYWLEKDFPTYKNAKIAAGYIRVIRNKLRFIPRNF